MPENMKLNNWKHSIIIIQITENYNVKKIEYVKHVYSSTAMRIWMVKKDPLHWTGKCHAFLENEFRFFHTNIGYGHGISLPS